MEWIIIIINLFTLVLLGGTLWNLRQTRKSLKKVDEWNRKTEEILKGIENG